MEIGVTKCRAGIFSPLIFAAGASFTPSVILSGACNPNLSFSSAAKDLDWDFCEVELLRNVVSVTKAGYGIEQKRGYSPKANERGISDGVPQCLLSPGCISYESHTAYFRMLLCERRRVINRPEIPSSVVRETHFLVGFAMFLVRSRTFHYAKLRLRGTIPIKILRCARG